MRIRNEVVAAINAALTSDDRVLLVEQEIMNGCTLPEIARAFAGAKWRFHLHKSGLRISIAHVDELRQSYKDELDGLKMTCAELVVQDQKITKPWHGIPQTLTRTQVARQARRVKLIESQINRHLQADERINADEPISRLLQGFGFEWLGGDLVFERGSGRLPYYQVPADNEQIIIPSGTSVLKPSPAKLLSALVSAAKAKDQAKVGVKLGRALQAGVSLRDIADAMIDTDYRYEVVSSGRSIAVQDFDDLNHSFTAHCGEVVKLKMMLAAGDPKADLGFRTLNIREPLGFACKALAIEADRLNRYLLPSEQHLEAGEYVSEFLADSQFRWNGEYEVERFEGENKRLLEAAIVYYNSPPVADAPRLH
ncbi:MULTISPECIES: hypothetical protein [Rhizobium]|uniref:hypothetical protein n=1 Tax=Rhizobium TaxID=379 RepID=UPI001C8FE7F2|nr:MULTISPECIES: hypothetical protein [Rhizobium]MBY3195073.1 hypothetical protein [Rhizobium laguerreae]MBY5603901.1 hypothetical protein [Rhizobium leguminosarum]